MFHLMFLPGMQAKRFFKREKIVARPPAVDSGKQELAGRGERLKEGGVLTIFFTSIAELGRAFSTDL